MKKMILGASVLMFFFSALANGRNEVPVVPRQLTKEDVIINAPAEKVWSIIKNYGDMSWHPGVKVVTNHNTVDANTKGAIRVLTLNDGGGTIEELLQNYDETQMTYKYRISDRITGMSTAKTITHAGALEDVPVLPVFQYSAAIKVESQGEKSKVSWKAGYWPAHYWDNNPPAEMSNEAANTAVTAFLKQGLANLKTLAEK